MSATLVGLISPFDTPLLDAIGSPRYSAKSTRHEWFEDKLNPNFSLINNGAGYNSAATSWVVDSGAAFRVGDIIKPEGSNEVLQVTAIATNTLTVTRGYGGSTAAAVVDNQKVSVIGHAALEGEDAPAAAYQNRVRKENFSQIFTESVMISGSLDAVGLHAVEREFDYQVIQRLRELLALARTERDQRLQGLQQRRRQRQRAPHHGRPAAIHLGCRRCRAGRKRRGARRNHTQHGPARMLGKTVGGRARSCATASRSARFPRSTRAGGTTSPRARYCAISSMFTRATSACSA
jgi:hypothetical protein